MRVGQYPLTKLITDYGINFKRNGREFVCSCPLHQDNNPSCRINTEKNTWYCDPCGEGGDAVEFVMAHEKVDKKTAMDKLSEMLGREPERKAVATPVGGKEPTTIYQYKDKLGNVLYEVLRYEPKTFRQRQVVNGEYVYSMDGVKRVLYNLPSIIRAHTVYVVEGEKDADTLNSLGFCATTTVGGSGAKWLSGYTDALKNKEVVIIPDNDVPGAKHGKKILEEVGDASRFVRVVELPDGIKDVTNYVDGFSNRADAKSALEQMVNNSPKLYEGLDIPVYGIREMEQMYIETTSRIDGKSLDISKTIPSFDSYRPLIGGELLVVMGGTSSGKSALAQNLAHDNDLTTLMFSLELPSSLMFERQMAIESGVNADEIEARYMRGERMSVDGMSKMFVCPLSGVGSQDISDIIAKSENVIGDKPDLVIVDYLQLMKGYGNRYEKTSNNAEQLKVLAKQHDVIMVALSQISRNKDDEYREVSLLDGKDSGSIENSAGLVMGISRCDGDPDFRIVNVLKCTKGKIPARTLLRLNGPTLRFEERANELQYRLSDN